jgi:hypothetical protein
MKFCCESFEMHYLFRNTLAHSIRIVKFKSEFLINQGGAYVRRDRKEIKINRKRNDIRFHLMTAPYIKFDISKNPSIMINFCPFCGTNLHKFYDKDEYANEIEGETFTL